MNKEKLVLNNRKLDIKYCTRFKDKLLGFMFQKNINYILKFKCKSIHTFFMKENIDVVITDKHNKVIHIFNNLKKNQIIIKLDSYFIYELPFNTNVYKVGDKLKIEKC